MHSQLSVINCLVTNNGLPFLRLTSLEQLLLVQKKKYSFFLLRSKLYFYFTGIQTSKAESVLNFILVFIHSFYVGNIFIFNYPPKDKSTDGMHNLSALRRKLNEKFVSQPIEIKLHKLDSNFENLEFIPWQVQFQYPQFQNMKEF